MKKISKLLSLIVCVLCLGLVFASCGEENPRFNPSLAQTAFKTQGFTITSISRIMKNEFELKVDDQKKLPASQRAASDDLKFLGKHSFKTVDGFMAYKKVDSTETRVYVIGYQSSAQRDDAYNEVKSGKIKIYHPNIYLIAGMDLKTFEAIYDLTEYQTTDPVKA